MFEFDDLMKGRQRQVSDEDLSDEDEQSCGSSTLNARDTRDYSISPARLDGAGFLRDLSDMSDCADRIDSILDQQEIGSSYASGSDRASRLRSLSPSLRYQQEEFVNDDDEVD